MFVAETSNTQERLFAQTDNQEESFVITDNIDTHRLDQKDVSVVNASSNLKTAHVLGVSQDQSSVVIATQEPKPVIPLT